MRMKRYQAADPTVRLAFYIRVVARFDHADEIHSRKSVANFLLGRRVIEVNVPITTSQVAVCNACPHNDYTWAKQAGFQAQRA
jgi:hypothetical protein